MTTQKELPTSKKFYKGYFKPKNPLKWKNPTKIIYRSSWEFKFMLWADADPRVTYIASEELSICYFNPMDQKTHRYFPDFLMVLENPKTKISKKYMIEIKPKDQCFPPSNKKSKNYRKECLRWGINMMKWEAAEGYCTERNIEFKILNEESLGL